MDITIDNLIKYVYSAIVQKDKKKILVNDRSSNYKQIVNKFIKAFENQNTKETDKIHFTCANIESFPQNCGQISSRTG